MRALRKPDNPATLAMLLVVCVISLLGSRAVSAENQKGIDINHANGLIVNGVYMLDADINYHLSDESKKALLHGVSLQIDIEMRVKMKRPWLWNKTVEDMILSYRLEHHPLSGNYIVTNLTTGNRDQFQSLSSSLEYLGTIKNYPLIKEDKLLPEQDYLVQIWASLNKQALPAPLRPLAYLSSKWHIASPRHEWMMQ